MHNILMYKKLFLYLQSKLNVKLKNVDHVLE